MVDNEIVRLAVDTYKGATTQYSIGESLDTLHQAMVAANNGKTFLDYRDIRDGKCSGLFSLVETILAKTIIDGLQGDEYFNALVDFRNVAEGDQPVFEVEDDQLYVVSEAAEGTQGIRRQRLGGVSEAKIPTSFKVVKVYEELNRLLANRTDMNKMIQSVSKAMRQKLLSDINTLWAGATANDFGGATYFPAVGTYSEDVLLEIIDHVEASTGKKATILGTKKAVRKLVPSVQGTESKSDLYNLGAYTSFYGTPVIVTPQRHKIGTKQFAFADNIVHVIAGDAKPIKCVYEGQSTIITGNPTENADLTQTFLFGEKYGMGIILAGEGTGVGRYQFQ